MKRHILYFLFILIIFPEAKCQFSYEESSKPRKFEFGFTLSPELSLSEMKYNDFNSISNMEIITRPGLGIGLVALYKHNVRWSYRIIISNDYRNFKLSFKEINSSKNEIVQSLTTNFSFQTVYTIYGPIKTILSYTPKILLVNKKSKIEENLTIFDQSIDFGIGYQIEFSKMKMLPELRYSYGLRNVWKGSNSDLGQAINYLKNNTVALVLTFTGEAKRKEIMP